MQHNGSRIREGNTNAEYRCIPVYDGAAGFIVLSLRNPKVLSEDREDCETTTLICALDGVNEVNAVVMSLLTLGTWWCCLTMRRYVDSAGLLTDETWLEEDCLRAETFGADSDDAAATKLLGLILVRDLRFGAIERNVESTLLDIALVAATRRGPQQQ